MKRIRLVVAVAAAVVALTAFSGLAVAEGQQPESPGEQGTVGLAKAGDPTGATSASVVISFQEQELQNPGPGGEGEVE